MIDSELEEADDATADHPSQAMNESASVEVLSAEVRVLQVGNGQIARSMYRQLDEATFKRFEPFGRVRDKQAQAQGGSAPAGGPRHRDPSAGSLRRTTARLVGVGSA